MTTDVKAMLAGIMITFVLCLGMRFLPEMRPTEHKGLRKMVFVCAFGAPLLPPKGYVGIPVPTPDSLFEDGYAVKKKTVKPKLIKLKQVTSYPSAPDSALLINVKFEW